MKRIIAICLALSMSLTMLLSGCEKEQGKQQTDNTQKDFKWRLSCEYSADNHQTVALEDAARMIEEQTDGHVKIDVYPNMALGDYTVVYGQVMTGDIEIAACPISPEYGASVAAINMPFLATSFPEFEKTYFPGGFMWDLVEKVNKNNNIKLLGMFNAGFMGLGAKRLDSDDFGKLTDSSKKTVLMRCPANNAFSYTMEAMGYATTAIPYSDLYSSLQSNLCEGWIGGSGLVNYTSFRDAISYFVDCRVVNECIPIHINQAKFNSLPEEYQKIVEDVFEQMQKRVNDERKGQEEQALEDLNSYGIKVISGTDEQITALRDRIRAEVWPKLKEEVGEDVIEAACREFNVKLK